MNQWILPFFDSTLYILCHGTCSFDLPVGMDFSHFHHEGHRGHEGFFGGNGGDEECWIWGWGKEYRVGLMNLRNNGCGRVEFC